MTKIVLRQAEPEDAPAVFQLLRALAEAVGEAEAFESSLEDVRRDGFGPERRYETIIAEADGRPAAILAFFATYSTYKGRPCLFVDDLYVAPWARGLGLGRQLMARVCRLAVERDCCRVELHVLDDNPARSFYEGIGLLAKAERVYTVHGPALERLAEEGGEP